MKLHSTVVALAVTAAFAVSPAAQAQSQVRVFSLDIGSDNEISDPAGGFGETADPGDVYLSSAVAGSLTAAAPYLDDASLFGGADPNPVQGVVASAVPVGAAAASYDGFFDLNGYDALDVRLNMIDVSPDAPLPAPILRQAAPIDCVYAATALAVSFDDDTARGWRSPAGARVPTEGPSPLGMTYGSAAGADEIVRLNIDLTAGFPAVVLASAAVATETDVHVDLAPDPFAGGADDDDVDALDVAPANGCRVHYFSVDSEGRNGMVPSNIYMFDGVAAPSVAIRAIHLGIPQETNIDAFEFAWVPGPNGGPPALALLFSVADDDPGTAIVESGGLAPNSIYASFLTGVHFVLVDGTAAGLDDIDAIAVMPGDPDVTDSDGDGIADGADNCLLVANPSQYDSNGDGYGNACDADTTNDCITNFSDLAIFRAAFMTTDPDSDFNGSGTVDFGDLALMRAGFFLPPGPSGIVDTCGN